MSTVSNEHPESQRLGDFEIVREIGRGGMGIVYEARQVSLDRKVALKVLGGALSLTTRSVERFHREAEAAARLHHTNIVPIYATGSQNDTHFYAMELIDGPGLDCLLHQLRQAQAHAAEPVSVPAPRPPPAFDRPVNLAATGPYVPDSGNAVEAAGLSSPALCPGSTYFDTVARLLADVADALEHAHRHGVIHRDVKPSNLLLSSDGRLSLTDFGLAQVLEKPGMTVTGEFVGTPAYMSPEQITAGRVPLDQRTDIYSLGATLYELLTLQPPFPGERRDQVLAQILHKDPQPPRKINRQVPADLETICLKAMAKEPDRRYQTAGQMAEDLRRFVNRFTIRARRPGPVERLRKWVRRHPAPAAALLVFLIATGLVAYFASRTHLIENERRLDRQRAALEQTTLAALAGNFDEARGHLEEAIALGASPGDVLLWRGQIALHRGDTREALKNLEEAARLLPDRVAAQAILLRAYHDAGQFDRFYTRYRAWRTRNPETAEDYLFLGQVTAYDEPEDGLPLLDEAIKKRDTALPRLVRAEVRTNYAQMTGRLDDAEQALDDVKVAQTMLPGDPAALTVSLEAHLVAAFTYERHNRPARSQEELEKARRDAVALGDLPFLSPKALRARLSYLDYVEDSDAVAAEYFREKERNGGKVSGRYYFFQLYRQEKFAEALEVLEGTKTGNEVMYHLRRSFVVRHFPAGEALALAEYEAAAQAGKGGVHSRRGEFYPRLILLLLGQKARAADLYRQSAEAGVKVTGDRTGWWQKGYEHLGGKRSAEDFLAAAGTSQWRQCEGHFFVGLNLLAGGDKVGAQQHFEQAVATRVLWFLEYEWSRAFLAMMEKDDTWPPWIK